VKKIPITLALTAVVLAPLVLYLANFHGGLTDEHVRWGELGSYLSGIYGSLALLVLAYTTHLTQNQFKRQNDDSVFYKLFDALQYRIQHSSVAIDGTDFFAHKSLKYIAEKMRTELSAEAIEIGRMLLCKEPENVAIVHYTKLLEALNGRNWCETFDVDREAFIADITAQGAFNERWEQLKNYIGSRGEETASVREALRATGGVNFYKIPFKERQHHYSAALRKVLADHGEFLDGYFRTILQIAEVASASTNRLQYSRYVQSQLTRYEVVILFYMLAGREEKVAGAENLKLLGLLNRLRKIDCQSLMIELPSEAEIDKELVEIFATEA
jgi:Putative phage abortive infection protein